MLYLYGESLEEMVSPLKEHMGVYVCNQSGCPFLSLSLSPTNKASLLFLLSCVCCNVKQYFTNYDLTIFDSYWK